MFKTPVVIFCFNRPNETKKFSIKLKLIQKLYIIMDGPRKNNKNDKEKCKSVKNFLKFSY